MAREEVPKGEVGFDELRENWAIQPAPSRCVKFAPSAMQRSHELKYSNSRRT
jgi:hypothetical protein